MTDFFADLEQELRAAHPRRSRPQVPVRPALVALACVVAIVAALSLVPTGEREVATDPGRNPIGAGCGGQVVDGHIPDALLDRFAILRGDGPVADLPQKRIPFEAKAVVRQSLRLVDGPDGARYVVAVVHLATPECAAGEPGVCLISLQTENAPCVIPGNGPPFNSLVDDLPDGRRVLAIIAEDRVARAQVRADRATEVQLEANTGFRVLAAGDDDPVVTPVTEPITPIEGDGCTSELDLLKRALPVFGDPPSRDVPKMDVSLPPGQHYVFAGEARVREVTGGARYVVFPGCGATVCMWREGTRDTVCEDVPAKPEGMLVLTHETTVGETVEIAGLVGEAVKVVRFDDAEGKVDRGFFHVTIPAGQGATVELVPPS